MEKKTLDISKFLKEEKKAEKKVEKNISDMSKNYKYLLKLIQSQASEIASLKYDVNELKNSRKK